VVVRQPPLYLCATRNGKLRSVLPSNYRFPSLKVGIDIWRPSGFTAAASMFRCNWLFFCRYIPCR